MKRIYFFLAFIILISNACTKGYLDAKPDQALLIPTKIEDFQKILDNATIMNSGAGLHSLANDDYEVSASALASFSTVPERNAYIWAADMYEGAMANDWNKPYQQVFYANVVLDGLKSITVTPSNEVLVNRIKGTAMFYRAFAFYQLVDEFAMPYNPSTAGSLMGIPLKLSSDVNERPGRGNLAQAYQLIVSELETAADLLPMKQVHLTSPGKLATWAMLARVYLAMGNYDKAYFFSDACLRESPTLLDYNTLSKTAARPIASRGVEVLYNHFMTTYSFGASTVTAISPEVVLLYKTGDLRKEIFLRDRGNGLFNFKGNYTGTTTLFSGLATDEMYLIRAECYARKEMLTEAMADLNTLLIKRWDKNLAYTPITSANREEALSKILEERRKELITRGTRWSDLKRLNQDIRFAKEVRRVLDNRVFVLSPNSNRYAFPIPDNEIAATGIQQNER